MLIVSFVIFCFEIIMILAASKFPYVQMVVAFIWGLIFIEEMHRTIQKQKEQNAN